MRFASRGSVRIAAGAVALVAALARLPGLHSALVQDEVASARILQEPTFGGMLARAARTESTPPLWYALGWAAHHLGAPLLDVRLLSVAAGALLAALVVVIATRFVSLPLSVLAGLFPALGGALVVHGRQLRAYELLALLTALFAETLLRSLARPSRRGDVALAAVVAAGSLTHYFFAFSAATALAWLWLDGGARAVRGRATAAMAVGGAIAAAWTPVFLSQYDRNRFWWIGGFRWSSVLSAPLRLFTGFDAGSVAGVVVSATFIALLVAGSRTLARRGAAGRLTAALAFGPLVLAGLVWLSGVRVFALRNLIEIAPFVGICAAAALALVPRRVAIAGAAITLAGLGAAATGHADSSTPPFDRLARALVQEGWRPSVPVLVYGNFFVYRAPLEWYLPHQPVLDPGRPLRRACGTVLVLARGRHARGLHGRHVGDYTVARLRALRPLATLPLLRRATLLADPAHEPRCAVLIRRGRLAAIN
jgi:hypothetical protein